MGRRLIHISARPDEWVVVHPDDSGGGGRAGRGSGKARFYFSIITLGIVAYAVGFEPVVWLVGLLYWLTLVLTFTAIPFVVFLVTNFVAIVVAFVLLLASWNILLFWFGRYRHS